MLFVLMLSVFVGLHVMLMIMLMMMLTLRLMCFFSREHGRSSALPARQTGKSDEGGELKGEAVQAGGAGVCGASTGARGGA